MLVVQKALPATPLRLVPTFRYPLRLQRPCISQIKEIGSAGDQGDAGFATRFEAVIAVGADPSECRPAEALALLKEHFYLQESLKGAKTEVEKACRIRRSVDSWFRKIL